MTLLTLLTDFGLKDGNVGVMKGVILGIAPHVQIVDLSHLIQPQNVHEAALILYRSVPYFPAGTIHVAVVDPGVGTARRPIAARLGDQQFVLPDNGLITLLLAQAEREGQPIEFIHLDRPSFWLPKVSHVFHGRDIFAPAAAHLARGVRFTDLGTPIHDVLRISFPEPVRTEDGWRAEVLHIDHFGNISTNLRREDLGGAQNIRVTLGGVSAYGLVRTFGDRQTGELVVLISSTDYLIVSQVNGNAAARLKVSVGDLVQVDVYPDTSSGVN